MAGQTGGGDPIMMNQCHRNAPASFHSTAREMIESERRTQWAQWPHVSLRDWCGEWADSVENSGAPIAIICTVCGREIKLKGGWWCHVGLPEPDHDAEPKAI